MDTTHVKNAENGERVRTYIAIDLKSFYASVECVERDRDPLTTNLVVADLSRTSKTICLAISPSMKAYGLPGRARLFEVEQVMADVNAKRIGCAPQHRFYGESDDAIRLAEDASLKAAYIVAKPRMSHYLQRSAAVYNVYLQYASPDDIHVYSIDEVFIDATSYLKAFGGTAHEMAASMIQDVLKATGITATAGIGPNMYLAKVAMDIVAKHIPADKDGVRIAELDEMSYRRLLWNHRPITDFWRVGRGYAKKLEAQGLMTMGDIARCSLGRASDYYNEDLLYRMFGVNAELLIDHAWGWEPCTMADIKAYRPQGSSISSGQVLQRPYDWKHARLVVREMTDALTLELVGKGLTAHQIGLYVDYDTTSRAAAAASRDAALASDWYGRTVPKPASGGADLGEYTSSTHAIVEAMMNLYDRIVNPQYAVRRINVVAANLKAAKAGAFEESGENDLGDGVENDMPVIEAGGHGAYEQPDLFAEAESEASDKEERRQLQRKEHDVQRALLAVKHKFGPNAVVKAMNLEEGATGMQRNNQIGGHAA